MNERQYLMQHILHLAAMLKTTDNDKQKSNIENALRFYAAELRRVDREQHQTYKQ